MRDINRIDKLQGLITEYWKLPQHNDMRYFQFVSYLTGKIMEFTGKNDLFFIEDDIFIELMEAFIKAEKNE